MGASLIVLVYDRFGEGHGLRLPKRKRLRPIPLPVLEKNRPIHSLVEKSVAKLARTRSWPVRANGLLLILQAAGLGGIGAYNVYQLDWQQVQQQIWTGAILSSEITETVEHLVIIVFALGLPAVLAVLAALGFLFLSRLGWLLGMAAQALALLACLLIYSQWGPVWDWKPIFIYPVMLYCIVMVLYLNSSDVRAAFRMGRPESRGTARGR